VGSGNDRGELMTKKKKYTPRKGDDWSIEKAREHGKEITDKEKAIAKKYKQWWDIKNKKWKDGFKDIKHG
jgi:hypothetical protein